MGFAGIGWSICLLTLPVALTMGFYRGCGLQTHSAYMLFYKRVELEEENGKDFSFDVSPDLLEVWRLVRPPGLFGIGNLLKF